MFAGVCARMAAQLAGMMSEGFVHGVLNTDNMAIAGDVIDYGPFAFLDTWDVTHVSASFDRQGRYSFGRQPAAIRWNLLRLGQVLQTLGALGAVGAPEALEASVGRHFDSNYTRLFEQRMLGKLGFCRPQGAAGSSTQDAAAAAAAAASAGRHGHHVGDSAAIDSRLVAATKQLLQRASVDVRDFFRELGESLLASSSDDASCSAPRTAESALPPHILERATFADAAHSLAAGAWWVQQ
jgi:uncharacterized protein YdiU (UPF0061 family)